MNPVRHGTLHLVAQTGKLTWAEPWESSDFLTLRRHPITIAPVFVASTEASPLYSALEVL